jgi:hypothetical protein
MKKGRLENGRPLLVSQDDELLVKQYVTSQSDQGRFVTKKEILLYAQENINDKLCESWLTSVFRRNTDFFHFTTLRPQEDDRIDVPMEYINEHISNLHKYISGMPSEMVFNVDESGTSEWENRKPIKVVTTKNHQVTAQHYPVTRKVRHTTLVACICASGDRIAPMVLSTQNDSSGAFISGIRKDIDLHLKIVDSAYVTEEVFYDYIETIFIPIVRRQRKKYSMENEKAVLLMDNFTSHCSDRIMSLLTNENIQVLTFPPHTSHVFQMLDLVTFGIMKTKARSYRLTKALSPAAEHVYKMYKAFEDATVSSSVRAAFVRAGLIYRSNGNHFLLVFNEEKVRENPDILEIMSRNVSISSLSPRRQRTRWGMMNEAVRQRASFGSE